MNWITAVVAAVALGIGIAIGFGISSLGGTDMKSLQAENEELARKNALMEQQVQETNEKFLTWAKNHK